MDAPASYQHVGQFSTDGLGSGRSTDPHVPLREEERAEYPRVERSQHKTRHVGHTSRWSPFWLRSGILAALACLFLAFTVTLPSLLAYSDRHHGIAEARVKLVYLWRFGPTAILTVVSILWSRVEFQTQRYKLWLDMGSGQSLSLADYHLDYTQLLLPTVLVDSLRRKHYTVFLVTLASVIIKVQIVLSPSLFEPSRVRTTDFGTINVSSSFDVSDNITDSSRLSYYFARSVQNFDLEPPFGVDAKCAYQTFHWVDKDGGESRGAVDSPVEAVVDAMFANMTCLHLESHDSSWELRNNSQGVEMQETDIEFRFESCEETIVVHESTLSYERNRVRQAEETVVSRTVIENLNERPCSSLPQQHPQLVYYSGACNPDATQYDLSPLEKCAAILCSPMAWVSKVEVVDSGTERQVSPLPNQDGDSIDVRTNIWDLLLDSIPGAYEGSQPPSDSAFAFRGLDIDNEGFLATNDALEQALVNLTDGLAPMIAHHALRNSGESQMDGWRTTTAERLQMNRAICFAMMSLFAVCALIAFWTLFRYRRVLRIRHRDPATVLGTMLFLQSDNPSSTSCVETLFNTMERDKAMWSEGSFTPFALRPWLRAVTVLYMIGHIAGLTASLRVSQSSDGIATVDEEIYSSLLWKSVPTLALLLVVLYVTSSDAAVRGIIGFASLLEEPCHASQLDISLLDMLGLHSLYRSYKLGLPSIAFTQGLAILCSFLAALSSVLFNSELSPELSETSFKQTSWFGGASPHYDPNESIRGGVLGAIGLTAGSGTLTYPSGTYGDLLFPNLTLNGADIIDQESIQVKMPAARAQHTCIELVNGTDITVDVMPATEQKDNQMIRFIEPMNCPSDSRSDKAYTLAEVTNENPYFGMILDYHMCSTGPGGRGQKTVDVGEGALWWTRAYAWGKMVDSGNGSLIPDHYSAWRCNFTWGEVETTANLVPAEGEFLIDHAHPPVPDESTTRSWNPLFPVPIFIPELKKAELYTAMFPAEVNPDARALEFSDQIALLMEPVGSLRFEDLGEPNRNHVVLEAINANTRLTMAQVANVANRLGTNQTSQTVPLEHGELSPVTGVVSRQRRRLFQNPTVTYILVAILSVAAAVNIWALISSALRRHGGKRGSIRQRWLLDLELKGVAPDGYSSLAMMGALLSGSNYGDIIPEDAHLMSTDQLLRHMADKRFKMGWFTNKSTGDKEFTIDVVGNETKGETNQERSAAQDRLLPITYDNAI